MAESMPPERPKPPLSMPALHPHHENAGWWGHAGYATGLPKVPRGGLFQFFLAPGGRQANFVVVRVRVWAGFRGKFLHLRRFCRLM